MFQSIFCHYPGCCSKPIYNSCARHRCVICQRNVQNHVWAKASENLQGKCVQCAICNNSTLHENGFVERCLTYSAADSTYCTLHKCRGCYRKSKCNMLCEYCIECSVCGKVNFGMKRCFEHNCIVYDCPRQAIDNKLCLMHTYLPNCDYCCDKKYPWGIKFVCTKSNCLWLKKHTVGENQYQIGRKIFFKYPKKISNTHRRNAIAEYIADILKKQHNIPRDISYIVAQYRVW